LHYENGSRSPGANYLMAMAAAGVDIAFALTGRRSAPAPLSPEEAELLADFAAADKRAKAIIKGTARLAVGKKV
jgi:hypothetical protein